jgi:hypothetical protein
MHESHISSKRRLSTWEKWAIRSLKVLGALAVVISLAVFLKIFMMVYQTWKEIKSLPVHTWEDFKNGKTDSYGPVDGSP